jgi:hypothetical protein
LETFRSIRRKLQTCPDLDTCDLSIEHPTSESSRGLTSANSGADSITITSCSGFSYLIEIAAASPPRPAPTTRMRRAIR